MNIHELLRHCLLLVHTWLFSSEERVNRRISKSDLGSLVFDVSTSKTKLDIRNRLHRLYVSRSFDMPKTHQDQRKSRNTTKRLPNSDLQHGKQSVPRFPHLLIEFASPMCLPKRENSDVINRTTFVLGDSVTNNRSMTPHAPFISSSKSLALHLSTLFLIG